MTRNKDGGYRLPDVIDPDRICVQIHIPNNLNHIIAFWAQIEGLGSALQWENDADHTALEVAEVWRQVYAQAHENWLNGGCMDDECCDNLIDGQNRTNELLTKILQMFNDGFKIVPLNGTTAPPDEAGGDCAPDFFDHNTGDTEPTDPAKRALALCVTVQRYIKGVMLGALRDMGAPQFVIDYILATIAQDVPLSLSNLTVSYPLSFIGLSAFFALVSAELSFDLITCVMVSGLSGDKNNTSSNFKASVPEFIEGLDPILVPLADLVRTTNQITSNYKAFNLALNDAFNEDLSGADCPCTTGDCAEELILTWAVSSGYMLRSNTVISPTANPNEYHIVQNTEINTGDDKYYASVEDSLGRFLHVEAAEGGQAVGNWTYKDISGAEYSGIGGFAPIDCIWFDFSAAGGATVDTLYIITCLEPE